MRFYNQPKPIISEEEALQHKLKVAAQGMLFALRSARETQYKPHREYWLLRAKKFKAYLERLGKNLK